MLYKVEIENFYSVREPQVLDLTVSPSIEDDDDRFHPVFPGSTIRAPKVVAIYGANASGKTTILRALSFLAGFIGSLPSSENDFRQRIFAFNDADSVSRPIRLAIELGGVTNPHVETDDNSKLEFGTYRYELSLIAKNGKVEKVLSEALRQRPNGIGRWQRIFERTADGDTYAVKGSDVFRLTGFGHLVKSLRSDASLIASFGYFNHPTASHYAGVAKKVLFAIDRNWNFGSNNSSYMAFLQANPELLERLNRELSRVDVGVEELRIADVPNIGPQGRFQHSGLLQELPWELESRGTQAFVYLFPLLALAFDNGTLALVDEFDTLIHPLVLPEILRWFYDADDRNKDGAQIWLTCHSATMLEDLLKEEVVVAEKDSQGRTRIYSLMDFKALRRGENLYKKYLGGVYGGVPVIG